MNEIITKNKTQLDALFAKYNVKSAYVFGSALNSNFSDSSDVDLIINFEQNKLRPEEQGEIWWTLYDDLKTLLNREIDIINEKKLKNPYFRSAIEKSKELIYG